MTKFKSIVSILLGTIFLFILIIVSANQPSNEDFLRRKITDSFISLPGGCGSVIGCEKDIKNDNYQIFILTANHLVKKDKPIWVKFPVIDQTGKEVSFKLGIGKVVFNNLKYDIAIIAVKDRKYIQPTTINIKPVKLLDHIYEIGRPAGSILWVTDGCIASLNVKSGMFGHSAATYFGNSGGPI